MTVTHSKLTSKAARTIRSRWLSRLAPEGDFLPSERALAQELAISRVTIRRALKQLVGEGLLEAIPSSGYRKLASAGVAGSAKSIAYVLAVAEQNEALDATHEQILAAFNRQLIGQGRHALVVGCKGRNAAEVFGELREIAPWGVALDTSRADYLQAALESELPCVVVDAHADEPSMDVVIQDNFNGARLAALWLVSQGHRVIGWLGPCRGLPHFRERFAGALAGLLDSGVNFNPAHVVEVPAQDAVVEAVEGMRTVLKEPDRPTAFLCMWQDMTLAAVRAVRAAGLTAGKDIELTGWGTELDYRQRIAPEFLGGEMPACVVWDPAEMAALTMARLEQRILNPDLPACRTDLKVWLEKPRSASSVLTRMIHEKGT